MVVPGSPMRSVNEPYASRNWRRTDSDARDRSGSNTGANACRSGASRLASPAVFDSRPDVQLRAQTRRAITAHPADGAPPIASMARPTDPYTRSC
ncbi:MAG: hypothetical protein DMF95_05300 [Acidobacteria bacterium]|nr:MAG: hypothetical protein DMF95_05300 [Acidobacteriota bacterium]